MDVLLIRDGVVVDCIGADSVARAQHFFPGHVCIERTPELAAFGPGDLHDGQSFTKAEQPEQVRHITRLAFVGRFSDAEAIAIDLASQGATVQAAAMRRYMTKINAALWIDLARTDTRAGVFALEAAGLLGKGRAAEILDAQIAQHERALETK